MWRPVYPPWKWKARRSPRTRRPISRLVFVGQAPACAGPHGPAPRALSVGNQVREPRGLCPGSSMYNFAGRICLQVLKSVKGRFLTVAVLLVAVNLPVLAQSGDWRYYGGD